MDLTVILDRVAERLDENTTTGVFYTNAEMTEAINEAQRLFVLLTLCLEKTATFALTAATAYYTDVRTTLTDYMLPLRVTLSNTRIRPATLHELDYLATAWEGTAGTPTHYAARGFNLLAVYPQPAAGGSSLSITYAYEPAVLSGSATPEIPEEYHPSLVDEATSICRLKEGGQEFQKYLMYHERFLKDAAKLAKYVRGRSIAQGYDRYPTFDLERHDISRQVTIKPLPRVPVPLIRRDTLVAS